ncbi:hypothetical protein RJT34_00922 [Clitoria ternatea]|uniref:Uncharacterized protein n=1 Tax=Clitoria ternatea TaxID=43366 RepID=A0AAN9PYA6_CLITE
MMTCHTRRTISQRGYATWPCSNLYSYLPTGDHFLPLIKTDYYFFVCSHTVTHHATAQRERERDRERESEGETLRFSTGEGLPVNIAGKSVVFYRYRQVSVTSPFPKLLHLLVSGSSLVQHCWCCSLQLFCFVSLRSSSKEEKTHTLLAGWLGFGETKNTSPSLSSSYLVCVTFHLSANATHCSVVFHILIFDPFLCFLSLFQI